MVSSDKDWVQWGLELLDTGLDTMQSRHEDKIVGLR